MTAIAMVARAPLMLATVAIIVALAPWQRAVQGPPAPGPAATVLEAGPYDCDDAPALGLPGAQDAAAMPGNTPPAHPDARPWPHGMVIGVPPIDCAMVIGARQARPAPGAPATGSFVQDLLARIRPTSA